MSVATEVARASQLLIDQANTAAKSLITAVFNVQGYGAKGDGVTDDTAAILATIAAAKAAGGGIVFFPPGTYLVSTKLTLSSNVVIMGTGATSIVKAAAGFNDAVFYVANTGASNVEVRDITIDGNAANVTVAKGVFWQKVTVGLIQNVRLLNCKGYNPIQLFTCTHTKIIGCYVENTTGADAIAVNSDSQFCVIMACTIKNPSDSGIVVAAGADYISVVGNTIERGQAGAGYGIAVAGVTHVTVTGNIIKGSHDMGILVQRDPNTMELAKYVDITANVISDCLRDGINVEGGSEHFCITGNIIRTSNRGIHIFDSDWGTVTGNHVLNCLAAEGIMIEGGQHLLVTGNTSVDDRAVPTQTYGLRVVNTTRSALDVNVSGNFCSGNLTNNTQLPATMVNLGLNFGPNVDTRADGSKNGVRTRVYTGAPAAGDGSDGDLAVASTTGRLYFKYGGAWHYVTQTA